MENKTVPYLVFEGSQARAERTIKRLIIALIIVTALMFISNIAWLWAWTSYDYVSEESTITVDSNDGGNANYIGRDGDINNGTNSGEEENQDTHEEIE